jgi:hypothetical protein
MIGPMPMRAVRLSKDGERLSAVATIRGSDLRGLAPAGFGIEPYARDGAFGFEGSVGVTGARASIRARVATRSGDVVVEPAVPLAGIRAITVFSDDRVAVERVRAEARGGDFTVAAQGRLR